ncbi:hypothetical protein NHQ30_003184 [Ciborinia camelliae]|nr:hypothetical protein NHQ30_003184 [Ciborinia camelliae]
MKDNFFPHTHTITTSFVSVCFSVFFGSIRSSGIIMFPMRSLSPIARFSLTAFAFKSQYPHQQSTGNLTSSSANITLDTYDYVAVGSGPGGAPLTPRLALADQATQLCLLTLEKIREKILKFRFQRYIQERDSKMTYETADGDFYAGLHAPGDATPLGTLYPRTGTLGGCAECNALITTLPPETDWQYTQNIIGDETWAPANMREYYKELESCHRLSTDATGHGLDGWLQTEVTNPELIVQDQKVLSLVIAAARAWDANILGKLITTATGLVDVLVLDINNELQDV